MVVSQSTPNDSTPTAARKQATTTTGRASGNASERDDSGSSRIPNVAASSIRRGRSRSIARPPQTRPIDWAARIAPHAAAPAEVLLRRRRAEHVRGSCPSRVHDGELQDDRPQPGPRAELEPALSQLGE